MKSLVTFAALLALTAAQYYDTEVRYEPEDVKIESADWYLRPETRQRRDVTYELKTGPNGKVFGTLGQNDDGLFGYGHNAFNDHRGKRTLNAYGDASHEGAALDWKKNNAAASLNSRFPRHSTIVAAAAMRWQSSRNSDVAVQELHSKNPMGRENSGITRF